MKLYKGIGYYINRTWRNLYSQSLSISEVSWGAPLWYTLYRLLGDFLMIDFSCYFPSLLLFCFYFSNCFIVLLFFVFVSFCFLVQVLNSLSLTCNSNDLRPLQNFVKVPHLYMDGATIHLLINVNVRHHLLFSVFPWIKPSYQF